MAAALLNVRNGGQLRTELSAESLESDEGATEEHEGHAAIGDVRRDLDNTAWGFGHRAVSGACETVSNTLEAPICRVVIPPWGAFLLRSLQDCHEPELETLSAEATGARSSSAIAASCKI